MHDLAGILDSLIDPGARRDVDVFAARFAQAQPFRHVVIENFLARDFANALLAAFPAFERGNAIGDDGVTGGKSTVERMTALGADYRQLDALVRADEFLRFVGRLTSIDDLLYDPFYLGGGTHENRNGQALQAHIDFNYHPSERWHRRLNLIVYLNPDWSEGWGGNLELWRDPYADAAPAARIVPAFNRCVIFETTEHSWHGFDRIALPVEQTGRSRKSIALYFYTTARPAAETAGKHTTHYVNRQLPVRLVAGHTLDAADLAELRELIAHRDNQLQQLYAENARLLQAQERGLGGQILYLLKRLYVRYRR
ncbi:2OG-Fe(II) oxygenase [Rudaea cellulosilytica]|uniref:2OG-Fe(II) oxygenase n=1 Tax=Rudaea cellulosilytica TaxID=540746 RepID=UPI00039C2901|nr:2OG-Fe(II) oxygenase [Rudaea cellulosilytica]